MNGKKKSQVVLGPTVDNVNQKLKESLEFSKSMLFSFPLLLHVHLYNLKCTNNHPYRSFITVLLCIVYRSFRKTQLRYYLLQETFLGPKSFYSAFFFFLSCCDIVSIFCNKSLFFSFPLYTLDYEYLGSKFVAYFYNFVFTPFILLKSPCY